jgi:hypothetical protein
MSLKLTVDTLAFDSDSDFDSDSGSDSATADADYDFVRPQTGRLSVTHTVWPLSSSFDCLSSLCGTPTTRFATKQGLASSLVQQ